MLPMRRALLCGVFLLACNVGLEASAVETASISNAFMSLQVTTASAAAAGPYVSSFTLNQSKILGDPKLPQSTNLASEVYFSPTLLGDTAPKGGIVTILNSTALTVTNISVYAAGNATQSLVALETWLLLLDGPTLRFSVKREFKASGTATADRFPAFVFQTTQGTYDDGANGPEAPSPSPTPSPTPPPFAVPTDWRDKVQMPTWISLDELMDPKTHQAWLAGGGWAALLSDAAGEQTRRVLLNPAGIEVYISTAAAGCRYSVSRPPTWIVQQVAHGAECALNDSHYSYTPGSTRSNTLSLTFGNPRNGLADFQLTGVKDPALASVASSYAMVYNMFMGWINGNSPASESCLHEVSIFTQMQGMYGVKGVAGQASVHQASAKQLDFLLADPATMGVNASGWLDPRWSIIGIGWPNAPNGYVPLKPSMGIIDQMPHTFLAVWYYAVNTGDAEGVRRWMPALDRMMGYMMHEMKMQELGVLTNPFPFCDGVSNHSCADNWLDDIRFGWHDGIVAAYAVRAVEVYAELKQFIGDAATAAKYSALVPGFRAAYNRVFWDDARGYYTDWVDKTGVKHAYWYAWTQYAAINFGIADEPQIAKIMASREALYDSISTRYNVSLERMFCQPSNLIPTSPKDITVDFDGEFVFPNYENGDCYFWHSGLELLAIGRGLGADAAYARFLGALPHFQKPRFWAQRYGWVSGTPLGDDVIADTLHYLYGFLFSAFNIRSTLSEVAILGPPASALEGASWTFGHLGKDITVTVTNGKQVITGE